MHKILLAVLTACGVASAMYQYDDYPVADYEYRRHRIALSPFKLFGGIDPDLIRKAPQSRFDGLPGIDRLTLSYEHLGGVQGSFGYGPTVSLFPVEIGGDNAFNAVSGGGFFRYYSGITQATYFQMALEYMTVLDAKFGVGNPAAPGYQGGKTMEIGGPQLTPAVGYCFLFDKKWFINVQAGYTLGYYSVKYDGGSAIDNTLPYGDVSPSSVDANGKPTAGNPNYKTEGKGYYEDGWRFGSFLHGAVELGFAF